MEEEVYQNANVDRRKLKALARRSDAKGLVHLAGHLTALVISGIAILAAGSGLFLVGAIVIHGAVLTFLFAPLHECIHRTAFKGRGLNDRVAQACGFVLLLPAGYFRAFHFQHHRFTQDPRRDPELAAPAISTLGGYLWHVSGLPYWRERMATLVRHSLGRVEEDFISDRQKPEIVAEARVHLAAYLALLAGSLGLGSALLVQLWVLPALVGQPLLRLFLLAEHSGCPRTPDMLVNSRTTATTKPLEWLCWNMNRHSAHHAYPALPFHALPRADALLASQPMTRSNGYIAVQREILRRLRRREADIQPTA